MKFYKNILASFLFAGLLASTSYAADNSAVAVDSDPIFKDFQKLHEDMNKIFEQFNKKFFQNIAVDDKFFKQASFSPKADLNDRGDYYEIKVDLPGVQKSETKVEVKDNILNIDAKSEKSEVKKDDKIIKKERFVGAFHKSMILPDDADADKLSTKYTDGVLIIKIPKK